MVKLKNCRIGTKIGKVVDIDLVIMIVVKKDKKTKRQKGKKSKRHKDKKTKRQKDKKAKRQRQRQKKGGQQPPKFYSAHSLRCPIFEGRISVHRGCPQTKKKLVLHMYWLFPNISKSVNFVNLFLPPPPSPTPSLSSY